MRATPWLDKLQAVRNYTVAQYRDALQMQGMSNIVWAYAKLGAGLSLEVVKLLDALAAEAVSQLADMRSRGHFIPQNLSNIMYGYAVLGYAPCGDLLPAIAREAVRQLRNFGPQELTNLVWALAKLRPLGSSSSDVTTFLELAPAAAIAHLADPLHRAKVGATQSPALLAL